MSALTTLNPSNLPLQNLANSFSLTPFCELRYDSDMNQTVLAIDVGNTRVKCGLLNLGTSGQFPECRQVITSAANEDFDWTTVDRAIKNGELSIVRSLVSGSNPTQLDRILDAWPNHIERPQRIKSAIDLKLTLNVDEPLAVGLDRALNAVAANVLRDPHQPAIVIDSGTATTVDLITADGVFAGGTILPGIELSAKALHHYTALLPLIEMTDLNPDIRPPGRNTHDAIQNGILYGHIGAIREIVRRLTDHSTDSAIDDSTAAPKLLLTGGAGNILSRHLPETQYVEFLSLRALGVL